MRHNGVELLEQRSLEFDAFGDALREFGAYEQAIPVWEHTINTWKMHADTPVAYDKLVQLLVEKGDMAGADRERRELLDTIRADSAWRRANADDADVLATAAALGEQTLFLLASNEARQARLVYEDLAAGPTSRYPDAVALYQSAASLLEQFMTDYPSSERTYDLGMLLGEVYYFDDRMDDAGRAFKAVRDARPGGKHFERAARGTAEVFEAAITAAVDRGDLTLPPEVDKDLLGTSPEPIELPELVAELVAAYDAWREFAPPLVAPQIALGAANIELRYLHVATAEKRFNAIVDQYCHTPEAKEARDHLVEIYEARGDTEIRDRVSFDYAKNICGDSQPVRVVKSVKIERDYGGAEQDYNDGKFLDAARGFYAVHTAVDASHKYHAESLYRAADSMQRAGKVATAASLWSEFTDNVDLRASSLFPEALLEEARAYRAAFDYEAAVAAYLELAAVADKQGSYGRASFDVRAEAHAGLWQAAELRNIDRVYYDRGANDPGAATLFIRFATAESDPVKASEAYLRAADVYQNAGDVSHLTDTYREWEQRFNRAKGVDAYHVHFLFRIAKAEEKSGDRRGALKSFAQVIDAYNKVKTPGSAETELAGESQFWLAEQKYRLFERYEFVWPAELTNEAVEAIAGPLVKLMEEATAEFGKLAQLKSTWTIAAAVRVGDVSAVFAHKIIDSPAPTSIGKGEDIAQEILDRFVDLMAEVAAPLFAEAEKQWQFALDTAKTDGVRNEWSKLALERLNAANPQKYPLLRDEIISREEEP